METPFPQDQGFLLEQAALAVEKQTPIKVCRKPGNFGNGETALELNFVCQGTSVRRLTSQMPKNSKKTRPGQQPYHEKWERFNVSTKLNYYNNSAVDFFTRLGNKKIYG
jgi:hypothetical protein